MGDLVTRDLTLLYIDLVIIIIFDLKFHFLVGRFFSYHSWGSNYAKEPASEYYLAKRWGPAVHYHIGFEWLWLNRGFTESPVDIQVTLDPIFADQRFAAEPPESDTTAPGTPNRATETDI